MFRSNNINVTELNSARVIHKNINGNNPHNMLKAEKKLPSLINLRMLLNLVIASLSMFYYSISLAAEDVTYQLRNERTGQIDAEIKYYKLDRTTSDDSELWEIAGNTASLTWLTILTNKSPGCYPSYPAISILDFTTREIIITDEIKESNFKVIAICGSDQGHHNTVIFLSLSLIPIGSIDFGNSPVNFTKDSSGGYYAKILEHTYYFDYENANGPMLLIQKVPPTPSRLR